MFSLSCDIFKATAKLHIIGACILLGASAQADFIALPPPPVPMEYDVNYNPAPIAPESSELTSIASLPPQPEPTFLPAPLEYKKITIPHRLALRPYNGLTSDLEKTKRFLKKRGINKRYIVVNKYIPGSNHLKTYIFDKTKNKFVESFESARGSGGFSCRSGSNSTPPGWLTIQTGSKSGGKPHWRKDNNGYIRHYMKDIPGSYCKNSHGRSIRMHSNAKMRGYRTRGKKSSGCFTMSPSLFKKWGSGKNGLPNNAIVYNVPPKNWKRKKHRVARSKKRRRRVVKVKRRGRRKSRRSRRRRKRSS